jgi:capsular exopolysaccharide synthesis family protein
MRALATPRPENLSPAGRSNSESSLPFGGERSGVASYSQALREHWLLIAALVVLSVGIAALYSFTAAKRWESEASLIVTPLSSSDTVFLGTSALREGSVQSNSVLTAARLVQTPEVAQAASVLLGGALSPSALLGSVEVEPVSQSSLVTVRGKSDSAEGATRIANAFADAIVASRQKLLQADLTASIDRLETRLDEIKNQPESAAEARAIQQRLSTLRPLVGAEDPTLRIASRAVEPDAAVWPRPKLSLAVALFAALLLGSGAALASELISPRVNRAEELLLEQRLPILARIPRMPRRAIARYLSGRERLPTQAWEAYRTLRASLATAGPNGGFPRTVLVSSSIPGEGKTLTSVNLAITLALSGVRVILVDADLRRPMIATAFGVPARSRGFATLLAADADPTRILVSAPHQPRELKLLLASSQHAWMVDLLQRDRIERVLERLKQHADVVIVDSPPVGEVADALALADSVDTVIVAVRLGHSRRDKLNELRRMLAQRGITPAGFVVTSRRRTRARGYYHTDATAPQRSRRRAVRTGATTPRIRTAEKPDERVST